MSRWPSLALVLSVTLAASPSRADEKCHLIQAAKLDLSTDITGRVNVPMTIGGKTLNMMIDTGGYVSTLTRYAVSSLGLHPEASGNRLATVYGGEIIDQYVTVQEIQLDRLKASKANFFVMSDNYTSDNIAGIMAPDVLAHYDADFDFANSTFRLFSQDHCAGAVVYWTTPNEVGRVAFHIDEGGHILVPVTLDGKEVRAVIDTGAADTVASLEHIEDDLDIDEKNPNLKLIPNMDPAKPRYRYPFKTLVFDAVTVNNPDITLVPDKQSKVGAQPATIVLGMNVLRHLHLYIAYGEKVIYVSPASPH